MFIFPGKIPFPSGLSELKGSSSCLINETTTAICEVPWFNEVNGELKKHLKNCTIRLKIHRIRPYRPDRVAANVRESSHHGYLKKNPRDGSLVSLSHGRVCISGGESELKEIIYHSIGNEEEEVERLDVLGFRNENNDQPTLTSIDIMQLATKCPKMVELNIHNVVVKMFPPLIEPWKFLRKLTISVVSKQCFKNVEFQDILPNLRVLHIEGEGRDYPTVLPDMSLCESLNSITLNDGAFVFPDKIPFPHGLRELKGKTSRLYPTGASLAGTMMESIFNLDEVNQLFQIYFSDCVVDLKIVSLKPPLKE